MVAYIPGIDDEEKYVYEISKSSYLPLQLILGERPYF